MPGSGGHTVVVEGDRGTCWPSRRDGDPRLSLHTPPSLLHSEPLDLQTHPSRALKTWDHPWKHQLLPKRSSLWRTAPQTHRQTLHETCSPALRSEHREGSLEQNLSQPRLSGWSGGPKRRAKHGLAPGCLFPPTLPRLGQTTKQLTAAVRSTSLRLLRMKQASPLSILQTESSARAPPSPATPGACRHHPGRPQRCQRGHRHPASDTAGDACG